MIWDHHTVERPESKMLVHTAQYGCTQHNIGAHNTMWVHIVHLHNGSFGGWPLPATVSSTGEHSGAMGSIVGSTQTPNPTEPSFGATLPLTTTTVATHWHPLVVLPSTYWPTIQQPGFRALSKSFFIHDRATSNEITPSPTIPGSRYSH